ncbi:Fur family transcriptional regulator [Candidatus Nitrospira inopinata]|jgi:Fe2+ or Zn2+ uptake regulation protein|uniref:Transcriptional regulator, Fur family n=1 Tax=Candidatus Nitrospira inopinata TaxID=1715989 RepID=A0A0S4KUG5_9BACT|nr:Fur family transcriptional regulator [Candidatus Nitrospira inopinata]CUQ68039.1 Transcriptional regulator, Fur family [Candidatus Nitrospira inopinata]
MTDSIIERLKAGGKKLTKARRAILGILEQSPLPMTAAELHARLAKARMPIDLVTVYRNLAMLEKLGLVTTVGLHDGQMRYEVRHGREHHHHIQCRGCGKIVDLMVCPIKKLTSVIEAQTQFAVDSHSLEFLGWCPQCR